MANSLPLLKRPTTGTSRLIIENCLVLREDNRSRAQNLPASYPVLTSFNGAPCHQVNIPLKNGLEFLLHFRSGRRESNPQQQLGRLRQYHFATPACRRHSAALRGSLPAHPPLRRTSWRTTNQSGRPDLNRRPLRPKRSALPSAPRPGSTISIPLFPHAVKVTAHPRIVGQLRAVALQSHGAQERRWFCQLGISAPRVTSGRRFPPSGDIR
jgi:hypothetical protein